MVQQLFTIRSKVLTFEDPLLDFEAVDSLADGPLFPRSRASREDDLCAESSRCSSPSFLMQSSGQDCGSHVCTGNTRFSNQCLLDIFDIFRQGTCQTRDT